MKQENKENSDKPLKVKNPNYAGNAKNFKGIKGGRPKGSKNKISGSLQNDLKSVYDRLGGLDGLYKWSKKSEENQSKFYNWCIQLLPKSINLNQTISHDLSKLTDEELQAIIDRQVIDTSSYAIDANHHDV
jgi:hypothetical protein